MNNTKEYKFDNREVDMIQNKIGELAESYVPEWKFDRENPDMGSVIAIIFANQMMENMKRYNSMLERYHAEFANLLGISLLQAHPAKVVVSMGLIQDIIPGVYIPKNSKLLGDVGDSGVIFETDYPLYITNARLTTMFMVSASQGKIIPLMGHLKEPALFDSIQQEEEEKEEEDFPLQLQQTIQMEPFDLFSFKQAGIEKNAIIFYHHTIFDIENEMIYIKIENAQSFLQDVQDGLFACYYHEKSGVKEVENIEVDMENQKIMIRKEGKSKREKQGQYAALALVARQPIKENIKFSKVSFSSAGQSRMPAFVGNDISDLRPKEFTPFGETLSLFSECYVGSDDYFSKAGARVTIEFQVEFLIHTIQLTKQQENEELKIIKRKPRAIPNDTMGEAYAEEISFEYYNGNGWKHLECDRNYSKLFASAKDTDVVISFISPEDWQMVQIAGYEGRSIRMQLLKSDNCYLMPCHHHYPTIKNMEIAYSYEEKYEAPERIECIYGTTKVDVTKAMLEEKPLEAFIKSNYVQNTLFLGFDKKMEKGPISILFQLDYDRKFLGAELQYQYSTMGGLKPLKVTDGTNQFTQSGTIRFMPPEDMAIMELEGQKCYWIAIIDNTHKFNDNKGFCPCIQRIQMNSVEASNIETLPEEEFYLETVAPYMQFSLSAQNILDADVFVNEKSRMTQTQMKQMLRNMSEDVTAEYDFLGEIQEFYVRWKEVDNFEDSIATDRHYVLDRMTNNIIFGDGIHVMIPKELNNAAFRITVRSCDGVRGNVDANTINETMENVNYIDGITNLSIAYGGTNLETVQSALRRSANMISSKKRMITRNDYVREVLAMSDNIDKASCIVGQSIDGSFHRAYISLVLLMKDYGKKAYSFGKLQPLLQRHLKEHCEVTVEEKKLQIVEPVTVEISVEIWTLETKNENDFEIHEVLKRGLKEYLNPVTTEIHNGWKIGEIPQKSQIMMKLNSLKTGAIIQKIVISARYTDVEGTHECDIESLPNNPFFICKNGEHKIHILTVKH